MTEKIKLTQVQAEAIRSLREKNYADDVIIHNLIFGASTGEVTCGENKVLLDVSLDNLIRALYFGYEVEPKFKVGDWVEAHGIVSMISGIDKDIIYTDYKLESGRYMNTLSQYFRYATAEEIAHEKERRFWELLGRKIGEFHEGDIGIFRSGLRVMHPEDLKIYYGSNDLIGFYPAESFIKFGGGN